MKFERLGDIVKNLDSRRVPLNSLERSERSSEGLYPYIGANNIISYIDEYIFDEKILCVAEDGGNWGNEQLCASIYEGKTWVNNHAHVLTENGKANLEYLRYYLNFTDLSKFITGTTRGKLTRNALDDVRVPLPDLNVQIKIANLLSNAESLVNQRKESISLMNNFLESTFNKMFGDPVQNEKGWETKTIEELVKKERDSLKRGPFGGALKKEIFVSSGYLVYEQYHALNNDFSFGRYYIDESKFQELKAFEVKPNDIIISCSGIYLGKLAIVPKGAPRGIINQALLKISLNTKIVNNTFFVFVFSNENFRRKYYGSNIGAGIPNFPSMDEFKQFRFIYPTLKLQERFAAIAEKVQAVRKYLIESLQQLENLSSALNQKAFKGELTFANISQRTIETLVESEISLTDKLDLTVIEKSLSKKSRKPSTYETINSIAGRINTYSPNLDDVLLFILETFKEDYFTFEKMKEATINSGWQCDFETLKSHLFQLLRERKLNQVFTDAEFKASFNQTDAAYRKVVELNEQIYLQQAAIL